MSHEMDDLRFLDPRRSDRNRGARPHDGPAWACAVCGGCTWNSCANHTRCSTEAVHRAMKASVVERARRRQEAA